MNGPLLFVVLDAFRHDYLDPERTPFLCALAEQGIHVERLRTASGFTQRSAILTGAWADRTGLWTMHTFAPDASPFRFLRGKRWPRIADALARALPGRAGRLLDARLRKRVYARARAHARHPSTARIPLHLLPFFSVSEDQRPVHEPGALPVPSLFDVFAAHGVRAKYLMYPEVDGTDASTERALVQAKTRDFAAYFGLLGSADAVAHARGPRADETGEAIAQIDRRLRRIDAEFRAIGRDPTWLVVGDHGMLDVTARIDVRAELRRRAGALVEGRDWLLFLDSTAAKLWALTGRAQAFVAGAFAGLETHGRVLDAATSAARRIPFGDRRYGDVAWLANPGVLIWPDFFHRRDERILGMHGYDPSEPGQHGLAILHGPDLPARRIAEAPLVDVCATVSALLEVPPPACNEGRSWLDESFAAHSGGIAGVSGQTGPAR
jgi:hypothetical protein